MFANKSLRALTLVMLFLFFAPAKAAERREVPDFVEFGHAANASQREEVYSLLDAFKESWAEQDVEAHMALFSEDAEWINAYARIFRGKEQLRVFLRERLFPNFPADVSRQEMANATLVSLRFLGDDSAVIHLYTDGSRGESAISGRRLRRTHMHLLMADLDEGWRIVHTAIMDARD